MERWLETLERRPKPRKIKLTRGRMGEGCAEAELGFWRLSGSRPCSQLQPISPSVLSTDCACELHFTLIKGLSAEAAQAPD